MNLFKKSTLLLLTLLSTASAQVVLRGPYLQNMTPNSVTIQWRTNIPTDSSITYGPSTTNLLNQSTNNNLVTDHIITLTNLPPNSTHYYTIGTTTAPLLFPSTNQTFTTAPTPGTPGDYRLWILGDSGRRNADAETVRDAFINYNGTNTLDGIIMLGDNAYSNGTDAEFQLSMFAFYSEQLPRYPLWSTRGNHERNAGIYYDIFTHPTQGEAGGTPSGSEAYYSFDYGSIHFICLDSFGTDRSTNGLMMAWLKNDLQATTQEWIVTFFHHPPYTKGSHNSDNPSDSGGILFDMRESFTPILEAYGVDLVMSGHSHTYERSYLAHSHTGLSTTFNPETMIEDSGIGDKNTDHAYNKNSTTGTIYMVNGSSSHNTSTVTKHPIMVRWLQQSGSVSLEVSTNELKAVFINKNGQITDRFQLTHNATLAPTITQSDLPTAAGFDFLDLQATLINTGTAETVVRLYYGTTPGSVIEDAWDHVLNLGTQTNGNIALTLPNLPPDNTIYFRFQARNAGGVQWAPTTGSSYVGDGLPTLTQPGEAPEPLPGATNTLVLPSQANWNYLVTNGIPATDWTTLNYNDNAWPNGPAPLGYGNGSEATILSYGPDSANKYITTYFRKTFINEQPNISAAQLNVLRDDGAVAYINGQEIARYNMNLGSVGHNTLAASIVYPVDETRFFLESIEPSPILTGTNILAIEVHQITATNPDLALDANLNLFTGPADIPLDGGQNISAFQAHLNATLLSPGQAPTTLTVYWGTNDAQTSTNTWTHQQTLTNAPTGNISILATNLLPQTRYYYRYHASNAFGALWAPHSASFITTQAEPLLTFSPPQPSATNQHQTALIQRGATWNYLITNAAAQANWNQPTFNDTPWSNGPAILGFGTLGLPPGIPISTPLSYGANSTNKNRTTYFRQQFNAPSTNALHTLSLEVLRDDGVVIYLNGQELTRDNLPAGTITYSTTANAPVNDANETSYFNLALNPLPLLQGTNTLAVELHQINPTSSDLAFDCALTLTTNEIIYTAPILIDLTATTATLQIELTSTGAFPTTINLYYDFNDKGTTPQSWTHVLTGGTLPIGTHQLTITNLLPNTDYTIRFEATNAFATTWTTPYAFTTIDPCNPDLTPPNIQNNPSNQTLNLSSNCTATLPDYRPLLIATDACTTVTLNQQPLPGTTLTGTTTRTIYFTAHDQTGNSTTSQISLAFNDIHPPILHGTNLTLNTQPNLCGTTVLFTNATASDCSAITFTHSPTSGTFFSLGTTEVTRIATDTSGNTATGLFDLIIIDLEPPSITCPNNQLLNLNSNCTAILPDYRTLATANDACTPVTLTQTPTSGTTIVLSTNLPITLTATDLSGNQASCQLNLITQDTQPPIISCPPTMTFATTTATCHIAVTFTNATASDCTPVTFTHNPTSGTYFALGTTEVTRIATDTSGNTATCQFNIIITDNIPPSITAPSNITASTELDLCGATLLFTNIALFDCSALNLIYTPTSGTFFALGTTDVTCLAIDTTGNSSTTHFPVIIIDSQVPQITCPSNQLLNLDSNCTAILPDYRPLLLATDNCSNVILTQTPTSGTTITTNQPIILTATDHSGNQTTCQFNVITQDSLPPIMTAPTNMTFFLNTPSCHLTVTFTNANATDCSPLTITHSPPSGSTFPMGITEVTRIATDTAGNATTGSFDVIVIDNFPPITTCPSNITKITQANACGANVSYTGITASDCSALSVAHSHPSGSFFPLGTTQVTRIISDSAGNATTCLFAVIILDQTPPLAQCSNTTLQLNSNETATLTPAQINGGHSDNCAIINTTLSQTNFNPQDVRTNLIQAILQDPSGNTTTCTVQIIILDRDGNLDTDLDGLLNSDDPDDDNDQLPDTYENTHGLDRLNPDDAHSDNDHDRMTARQEHIAGTLPNDPNSLLTLSIQNTNSNTTHILNWPSVTGHTYAIHTHTNLLNTNLWELLTNNLPNSPYTNTTTQPRTYYRISVTNTPAP